MAKYIEEQEILWRMNNALDEQDTYLPIHFKELVIDECNPSDVIERSEIDKALEMTYKVREMVLHSNRTYEVNDVLDIIDEISACFERHIGE